MIKEAIILAGGMGTRLRGVIDDIPKSMAPVAGKPFLEYQLSFLEKWGIQRVVLSVGYKRDVIQDHFKDNYKSMEILYAIEEKPLGTGGGIMNAFKMIEGHVAFVFNGDTYFDVNLKRLNDFRWIKDTDAVMILRYEDDVSRYGAVEFDSNNQITRFAEKSESRGDGYINGGIYLLVKSYMEGFDFPERFSIEKDFFQKYYKTERIYGLRCFSYFRDIGVPEDYEIAQDEFQRLIY